jgi:hypothetical protein
LIQDVRLDPEQGEALQRLDIAKGDRDEDVARRRDQRAEKIELDGRLEGDVEEEERDTLIAQGQGQDARGC